MTNYNVTLRGDNSTYGIIKQYFTNGVYATSSANPDYANVWCSGTENLPTYHEYYNASYASQPIGGPEDATSEKLYKQLLYIKTPPEPFQGAEISAVNLKCYMKIVSGMSYVTPVGLYKINQKFNTDISSKYFAAQVVNLYSSATGGIGDGVKNMNASDTTKRNMYGDNRSATATDYPYIYATGMGTATRGCLTYIAFDDEIQGIAYEPHTAALPTGYVIVYAQSNNAGSFSTSETPYYDETQSFRSGERIFFPPLAAAPVGTLTAAQIRTNMIADALSAFGAGWGGTVPAEVDLVSGKYWMRIHTYRTGAGSEENVQAGQIRPIYIKSPSYMQYENMPAQEYYWNMSVSETANDNDAFTMSNKYNNDPPYGIIQMVTPTASWALQTFNITDFVTEWGKEYYFAMCNENRPANDDSPSIRATAADYCYLEITTSYTESDSLINDLKIVRNDADPTKIKVTWTPIKDSAAFTSYVVTAKKSTSTTYATIATITDIGTGSYVIDDASTDIDDTGGTAYCNDNNITIDIQLKINLASSGYATGYAPYQYSNIVQCYRPGVNTFTMGTTDPRVAHEVAFTYISENPPDTYPLAKRIITWRDDSVTEEELDPVLTAADPSTVVYHKYNETHVFTSEANRPYIQWETTQGIRSGLNATGPVGYCSTSFSVLDSPPVALLSVPQDKIATTDTLKISAMRTYKRTTNVTAALTYHYAFADASTTTTFTAGTANNYYSPTISAAGTYYAGVVSSHLNSAIYYLGTGFDWVVVRRTGTSTYSYLDASNVNFSNIVSVGGSYNSMRVGPTDYIFLFSKTPFDGLASFLYASETFTGGLSVYYWNGSAFAALNTTGTPDLVYRTAAWTTASEYNLTAWTRPSALAPITAAQRTSEGITVGDTTNDYYCYRIAPVGGSQMDSVTMILAKMTFGENLSVVTVASNTPTDMSAYTNLKFFNMSATLPRTWIRNMLDGDAGVEFVDNGFGGYEIECSGVLLRNNAITSGNYLSNSNLSSKDKLWKIMKTGQYVQLDFEDDLDKYRGRIADLSYRKDGGEYRVGKFDFTLLVDKILVYVDETVSLTKSTSTIAHFHNSGGYAEVEFSADPSLGSVYYGTISATTNYNATTSFTPTAPNRYLTTLPYVADDATGTVTWHGLGHTHLTYDAASLTAGSVASTDFTLLSTATQAYTFTFSTYSSTSYTLTLTWTSLATDATQVRVRYWTLRAV